mmetsp:Transcript_3157/g.1875  ORF Transcript_3157/g.1875 Transcript_3157/m.1875 type:complete len:90 (-) Transcript_3157:520-789(-)
MVASFIPYFKIDNQGPAIGRSLFEDTAEYALGMKVANDKRRKKMKLDIERALLEKLSPELKNAFQHWLKNMEDADICDSLYKQIKKMLG